jgi:hypothetical protein
MIRNIIVLSVLFILYEGFCLLPDKYVVLPGTFRMLDSILIVLPVFAVFFSRSILQVFNRFGEESFLIVSACILVLISPLMAQFFFGQPYLTGLLLMRHSLSFLTFFMFVLLMRPGKLMEHTIRFFTIVLGVWVFILILTKHNHNLGLIYFREGYYNTGGSFTRFGDSRLFFPYYNLTFIFYFIALARLLHGSVLENIKKRYIELGFVSIITMAVLATYSRMLVFSFMVSSMIGLFTAKNRVVRYSGITLCVLIIGLQMSAMAVGGRIPFIEESRLGKIALQSSTLEQESGRKFQFNMYVDNFLKSPVTGVGNIASGKYDPFSYSYMKTYRKFGIFNNTDLGYPKMAAESGLAGLLWVAWLYWYLFRKSGQVLSLARLHGNYPMEEAIAYGFRSFLVYMAVSGFLFPHFATMTQIPATPLALAMLAVTRESLNRMTSPAMSPALLHNRI